MTQTIEQYKVELVKWLKIGYITYPRNDYDRGVKNTTDKVIERIENDG